MPKSTGKSTRNYSKYVPSSVVAFRPWPRLTPDPGSGVRLKASEWHPWLTFLASRRVSARAAARAGGGGQNLHNLRPGPPCLGPQPLANSWEGALAQSWGAPCPQLGAPCSQRGNPLLTGAPCSQLGAPCSQLGGGPCSQLGGPLAHSWPLLTAGGPLAHSWGPLAHSWGGPLLTAGAQIL